jgi:hypothetical protein
MVMVLSLITAALGLPFLPLGFRAFSALVKR